MSKKVSLLICLASIMGLWGCSNDKVAGTVTDTGNTIAGVVHRVDGSPASNAVVRMARMSVKDSVLHVPEQKEVTTDSKGMYSFDSVIAADCSLYHSIWSL